MGKTKTKYPVEITIQFIHPVIRESYNEKLVIMKMNSSPLRFGHIQNMYKQFLEEFNINTPAILEWISDDNRQQITQNFQIDVVKILDELGGTFTIIVQSYIQVLIEQINEDIEMIHHEIEFIKDRLNDLPTREELMAIKKPSTPVLTHNQTSVTPQIISSDKKLDILVLFSEPYFDQVRKTPALNPVNFKSEIQRLHTALKSSIKADINLKCQIATKQNLKHLIKFLEPKILHIICHGTKDGALQFQDDSRTVLGALQLVRSEQIIQTLRSCAQCLPQVVFINSCYSQKVGEAFFKLGVGYVIAIQSEDTIDDEAAQIFSQHFYRNIFNGEKVMEVFIQAKERVKMKHNSFGCCCRHSSKQKHKKNCRWLEMIRKSPNSQFIDIQQKLEKHKLFHVPTDLCKCELKHLNRHKRSCQWARQALFHINNDFRIPDEDGFRFPKVNSEFPSYLPKDQLVICCCFNYEDSDQITQFRLPHSQSNKFKIFQNKQKVKNEVLFDVSAYAGKQIQKQINDITAPQLLETHQKIEYSIKSRQREIFEFMKRIKDLSQNLYIVYGPVGVGRTSFVLKCVTYLIQRRAFQLYFYIDLYGIKDKDVFRYKFNQITKFNYDGQVKLKEVKNKMMIIILDNADDFFELQQNQLYDQLKNLRQQLYKSKIILTFKEQNCNAFDFQKIHSEKFALQPLPIKFATELIFQKMRHLIDISVQCNDVGGLVRSNNALRIPKFIESLCQSFSSTNNNKKIKIGDIKKKLETILQSDMGGNKLIQQNLKTLKQSNQASYNLLLFISQFSQGISIDDFKMLSIYDKKDSKIHLPIGKNWEIVFATLFERKYVEESQRQSTQTDSNSEEDSEISNPSLKNIHSIANHRKQSETQKSKQIQKQAKGESYFLDQVSDNRYIVKRFIRDFIWKKHQSPQNFYMKHIFVGYMAVMIEIYFKWLVNSKYIHEDLIEYSAVSQAGLFGFKNNVFNVSFSLTESVRIARQYNSEFQRIVSEHPTVADKIRKSDPSIFIANHKQDFLNIYQKRWDHVFQYLKEKKTMEDKICLGYLQNLMIFIPTAFKIAKVQTSLLKYIISKSQSLLQRLRKYSEEQKYSQNQKILAIQLKLQLMRASIDIQKIDVETLKGQLELNKDLTIKLVRSINDTKILEYMKRYWAYQKTYMLMYKEFSSRRQSSSKSYIEKNKSPYQKIKLMIENIVLWLNENWDEAEEVLTAKRNLIIGLTYLNVLKINSGAISIHTNTVRLKKQHQKTILKMLHQSVYIFKTRDLMKLCLRAKLTFIQIYAAQIINPKKKPIKSEQLTNQNNQLYQELTDTQKKIQECENIYTDRKNNLIGFMEFQNEIKTLKKLLKEKFWNLSSNTLVCMRPVPLTIDGKKEIKQNLVRKKNRFRKQIQKIVNPEIDLCSKFQILTTSKLKQEVQNGCTMLLLTTNVKIYDKKPFLVFEGIRLEEDLVEINKKFVQQYDMSKIKILMIVGNNSYEAIRQFSYILEDPPILISLSNSTNDNLEMIEDDYKKDTISYERQRNLQIYAIEDKRRCEIAFLKQFVRLLMSTEINSKQQILQICADCQHIVKGTLELRVLSKKRKSPIQIKHQKGTYKDLSPGYQKNHNIDMKTRNSDNAFNFICLRGWKNIFRVFQHIRKRAQEAKAIQNDSNKDESPAVYINVFGDIGSGKTTFVQQIARLFVQRERYSSGVYIIDGKLLETKYHGEFENYFTKQSQVGKIMTLQEFQQNGNQNLMLIIDDFHMIKPRSNGRFYLFLQKIVDKKVNLILVTNTLCQQENKIDSKKDSAFIFRRIKPIEIQKLCQFQIDIIASNILDLRNQNLFEKYEELKRKNYGNIKVQDVYDLKSSFYGKKKQHDFLVFDKKQMKKMQSSNQG